MCRGPPNIGDRSDRSDSAFVRCSMTDYGAGAWISVIRAACCTDEDRPLIDRYGGFVCSLVAFCSRRGLGVW